LELDAVRALSSDSLDIIVSRVEGSIDKEVRIEVSAGDDETAERKFWALTVGGGEDIDELLVGRGTVPVLADVIWRVSEREGGRDAGLEAGGKKES
jgi:hypothetical protein